MVSTLMKKIISDIRLTWQRILEMILNCFSCNIVVLMFHQVREKADSIENCDYCIGTENFIKLIEILETKKIEFVKASQIDKAKTKNKKVILTFDDAYVDVYKNVFPYLKNKEIPFTVFQTIHLIGKENYLSAEMIHNMRVYDKFELGAHSLNHEVPFSMNRLESIQDAVQSKEYLNSQFNISVNCYAYPYGSFNNVKYTNVRAVRNADYALGFSTIMSGIKKVNKYNQYFLPRINVNNSNFTGIINKYFE